MSETNRIYLLKNKKNNTYRTVVLNVVDAMNNIAIDKKMKKSEQILAMVFDQVESGGK